MTFRSAVHDAGDGDADRHVDELALDLEALLDFLEQGLYRVGRDVVEGSQFIAEHLEDGRSRFFFEDCCGFFIFRRIVVGEEDLAASTI